MQQDNDPKYTANKTKDFIKGKNWKVLDWPSQSPDFNLIEDALRLEAVVASKGYATKYSCYLL